MKNKLFTIKMRRFLFFILLFPHVSLGQPVNFPTKADLTKIYSQAIADFIKDATKRANRNFDTLFIGKRKNGQPDDFPDIQLPETIEKVHLRLISPEIGKKNQNEIKSRIYINIGGWVDSKKAEFVIFVFSNGFEHQYNYSLDYKYNVSRKEFELTKLQFKRPLDN